MAPRKVTYSRRSTHAARSAHARGEREFKKYDTSAIRPKKRHDIRKWIAAFVMVVIAAIIVCTVVSFNTCSAKSDHLIPAGESKTVEIEQGLFAPEIGSVLFDEGVIENTQSFISAVNSRGDAQNLKPGVYTFTGGMTYDEVIDSLVNGPGVDSNPLVVTEGATIKTIAASVEKAYEGKITADQFTAAANNASAYAADYPFVADAYNGSLEGFLFPKTYERLVNATAEDVVRQMLEQYKNETASLDYSYAQSQGLSQYDVLKLASIIEKESIEGTRSKVSAVFYNRLTTEGAPAYGMIGSDATTAYEIGEEPTNYDWNTDSPYNTRKVKGLPPTPISSPSLDCLKAACQPEENFSDYYFFSFWPNDNGGIDYFFDKTYEEHQATIAAHA